MLEKHCRHVRTGLTGDTSVICIDGPGDGGACHKYQIRERDDSCLIHIDFQQGPVKDSGANGCTNEDLIAIVIDRLKGFQDGPFVCKENGLALAHLKEALFYLESRTRERLERGVEGTSKK